MADKTEVSEVIRRLVTNAREILGSKLAMDLKAAVPDWNAADHGARSLRDFIVAHVDGVVVAGRSGMDVLYRPKGTAASGVAAELAPSADAWRTWVSPNSPFALAFNAEDGSSVLVKRADEVPEGHVRIEPATVDEHRAIAREYLGHVPEPAREALLRIAELPDNRWWRRWLMEVEKIGELSTWNTFRHGRLRELLKTRLEAAGLNQTVQAVAARVVAQGPPPRSRRSLVPEVRPNSGVRAVVATVLARMSDEELRDLKLPVGLVIDVLDEMKR